MTNDERLSPNLEPPISNLLCTMSTELRTNLGYLLLAIVLVLASWFAPVRSAEIRLRDSAVPAGRVLKLGDLADVTAADLAEQEELLATELMPAPAEGESKTLRLREVQDLLALRGVAVGDHHFSGAAEVQIGAAAATKQARTLRPSGGAARGAMVAVQNAIAKYLALHVDDQRDWQVTVELSDEQVRAVNAAFGRLVVSGGAEPWHGKQTFTIQAGGKDRAFAVDAEVAMPDAIVAAARPLAKGDIIRETDLVLVPAKRNALQKSAFRSLDEVVGQEAVRSIAAGQVLDANYVQPPVLVKRGDVVTVYAHASGVRIKTTARARQSGSKGELVEVEALADRKRYFARVSDVQVVEVFAAATSAGGVGR